MIIISASKKPWMITFIYCTILFLSMSGAGYCEIITVSSVAELENAVALANSSGGNKTILLRDGTYTLNDTLYINTPNVIIRSLSGSRENVIIQGDAMSGSARVGGILRVTGSYFEVSGITMQKCRWHIVQIVGESNADNAIIRNCILRDSYEMLLKGSMDFANPSITADNGLVENCLFEYSAGIGPQYYIGGIDVHGGKNWIVRNNTFKNIISPSQSIAEHAIHFWNGAADMLVEINIVINCDRAVGFGLDGRGTNGGIIRNNMIYHAANLGLFADVSIYLVEAANAKVYNNTIYQEHGYPRSIEYRFASTSNALIVNNLTNKPISSRDGATGTVASNIISANVNWFVNPSIGDLHLSTPVTGVIDSGINVTGLVDDFDGDQRPIGNGIDIGADEWGAGPHVLPFPPANLRVM